MKPEIVVATKLVESYLEWLQENFTVHLFYDLSEDASEVPESICGRVRGMLTSNNEGATALHFKRFPKLEIVAHYGVGVDKVDLESAKQHGIIVTNTPEVLNEDVADMTMALALSVVRGVVRNDMIVRDGNWGKVAIPLTRRFGDMKIGILGLGGIGKAIALRCQVFGAEIMYHNRTPDTSVSYTYCDDLKAMASECDVLFAMCPATQATHNIINREVLDCLGPNGFLVNTARGSLVDEPELIAALQENRIAGAALDVFVDEPHVPKELLQLSNVVLQPHQGSATTETRLDIAELTINNLIEHFNGNRPLTPLW